MPRSAIPSLPPRPPSHGAPVRVSAFLRDGSEALIDHREVTARLQPLVDANEGADILVLLSTGSFSTPAARSPLIKAGPVVDDQVATLGRFGQ